MSDVRKKGTGTWDFTQDRWELKKLGIRKTPQQLADILGEPVPEGKIAHRLAEHGFTLASFLFTYLQFQFVTLKPYRLLRLCLIARSQVLVQGHAELVGSRLA